MVRMIVSLKQCYACWYCLSVGGIDMRGGSEGEVYLGSIGVSNTTWIYSVVKCTISEYILLSRFKCPVGFLHIIFSIRFIPIYQSKGRLSWK